MGLRQRHLVLQVLTANSEDKPFSVELGLTVASGTRRRLVLSSAFRAVHCTPHHAQVFIVFVCIEGFIKKFALLKRVPSFILHFFDPTNVVLSFVHMRTLR